MKIAIVHDWINGYAGMERVLTELKEIYPDAQIFTSVFNREKTPEFNNFDIKTTYLQKYKWLRKKHQLLIPLMPQAFESLDLREYDVIISNSTGYAKGVITHPGQLHINYCHTPIRYAWRLGGDNRNSGWLKSSIEHKLRLWDVLSAKRPDYFIGNSKNVKARIEKIYRRESDYIYPPVSCNEFSIDDSVERKYFLQVGRLVGYKRPDIAVEACVMTKQPLKIVGTGPELDKLKELAKNAPWIEFLGRVSDEELPAIYAGAKAFIFPAEEDFGIVPVEAMASGRPVIAYGVGGAIETVIEGLSGVHFKEQTAKSLASIIEKFNILDYDSQKIRQHALKFDKEVFKKNFKEYVESKAKLHNIS